VKNEYRNAITLIRIGADLKNYVDIQNDLSREEKLVKLNDLMQLTNDFIEKHRQLWLARNKPGGLDLSVYSIRGLQAQIKERQAILNKGALSRGINRFKEKIVSAGLALVL
jgi:hypothetical protein